MSENCTNFIAIKDPDICRRCFWASPESYEHIAMKQERAIYIVWSGDEIEEYEEIKKESDNDAKTVQNYIKDILKRRKKLKNNN